MFDRTMRAVAFSLATLSVVNAATASDDLSDAVVAFDKADYRDAAALWEPLAKQGNPAAETGMGKLFDSGLGYAKNPARAVAWFQRAAEHGSAEAQCILGLKYLQGIDGISHDVDQGLTLMKKAVDNGEIKCARQIGELYRSGLFGVKKDPVQALAWHRKGAELGDALAAGRLGTDYELGVGTRQDSTQATYWYQKALKQTRDAADRGDIAAQLTLGQVYEWGAWGAPIDKGSALYWCKKAALESSRLKLSAEECVDRLNKSAPAVAPDENIHR